MRLTNLRVLALLLSGCASVSGTPDLLSSSPNHQLNDTAAALRLSSDATLALPRELDKRPLPSYTVEPGDALLIQPADLDSPVRLPGDQPVLPDGTINLGRYGPLQVAGKSVAEIEVMVRAAVVAQTKNAGPITVRLVARQSKVFYVLGEVNAPGAFPLNGREDVLDALVAAGGPNDRASRANIILSRPTAPDHPRIVLHICYDDIVKLGDTTTNYQLAPGDRIYVAGRSFFEWLCGDKPHKKGAALPGTRGSRTEPMPTCAGASRPQEWTSSP